jgi:quercetin dioxygenase-like cupin family protein
MARPLPLDDGDGDRRTTLFGGRGSVLVWDLLRGRTADPFSAVLACELEPRGSVGAHVQQRDPEIVLCLAGRGVAEVDGAPHPLAPGALVHLPLGKTLALRNESDEPLFYLIVKAESGR